MISPTIYLVLIYMLAVPMIAAVAVFILEGRKLALIPALLLLAGVVYCGFRGILAIQIAVWYVIPAVMVIVAIVSSAATAVACIQEHKDRCLKLSSVANTIGCYIIFLMIVFFTVPSLRWCEGCMEWH